MLRLLLILIAGLVFSGGALAEQTLRLMANTSPPCSDEKLPERGLALELVEHIFSRTDYKPEIDDLHCQRVNVNDILRG